MFSFKKYPARITKNEKFEVWHKLDSKFKKPQGYISINMMSPNDMKSAHKYVLASNFVQYLVHKFQNFPAIWRWCFLKKLSRST